MSKVVKLGSGEVELSRPSRRRFSAGYKLKILEEADACSLVRRHQKLTLWRHEN